MIENALSGIVLTAETFNPSVFTETWLDRNDILKADSLVGVRLFSPQVAQFQTPQVQVMVIPQKLQITFPIMGSPDDLLVPMNLAKMVVKLLPHTPYKALGLNFDYFISQPIGTPFDAFDKGLLGDGDYGLLKEFSAENAKFGRYFSRDYEDFRLRLDIKPVTAGPENKNLLHIAFNFHQDIIEQDTNLRVEKIVASVDKWLAFKEHSEKLVAIGSAF